MTTNVVLTLDARRKKQDGSYPLILRLSHNRKTISLPTGYSVPEKHWASKNRCIKPSYKGTESPTRLNNYLVKKKALYVDEITKMDDKKELDYLSINQVKARLIGSKHRETFFNYTEQLIQDLVKAKRFGTARSYRHTLSIVKTFRKGKDFALNELNYELLKNFEVFHLSRGNSWNGLAVYMRTIRAIFNKAINDNIVDAAAYPFKNYKIKTTEPAKRAVAFETIQKIVDLHLEPGSRLFHARNYFLLSFNLMGMPYVDLAYLRLENIVDGRIQYIRQKTKKPRSVKIPNQIESIIESYKKGKEKSDYLLPILKRDEDHLKYKDLIWARQNYNKDLKRIAKIAGTDETLTSYVPRHSFASIADDMELPLTAISGMLGHSRVGTTQAYIETLRKNRLDDFQERIIKGK